MLGHRLWPWPEIKTELFTCGGEVSMLVFDLAGTGLSDLSRDLLIAVSACSVFLIDFFDLSSLSERLLLLEFESDDADRLLLDDELDDLWRLLREGLFGDLDLELESELSLFLIGVGDRELQPQIKYMHSAARDLEIIQILFC